MYCSEGTTGYGSDNAALLIFEMLMPWLGQPLMRYFLVNLILSGQPLQPLTFRLTLHCYANLTLLDLPYIVRSTLH